MNTPAKNEYVDVRLREDRRRGQLKQTADAASDLSTRLSRFAGRFWSTAMVLGGLGLLCVALRVAEHLMNGNAARLLDAVTRGH